MVRRVQESRQFQQVGNTRVFRSQELEGFRIAETQSSLAQVIPDAKHVVHLSKASGARSLTRRTLPLGPLNKATPPSVWGAVRERPEDLPT